MLFLPMFNKNYRYFPCPDPALHLCFRDQLYIFSSPAYWIEVELHGLVLPNSLLLLFCLLSGKVGKILPAGYLSGLLATIRGVRLDSVGENVYIPAPFLVIMQRERFA